MQSLGGGRHYFKYISMFFLGGLLLQFITVAASHGYNLFLAKCIGLGGLLFIAWVILTCIYLECCGWSRWLPYVSLDISVCCHPVYRQALFSIHFVHQSQDTLSTLNAICVNNSVFQVIIIYNLSWTSCTSVCYQVYLCLDKTENGVVVEERWAELRRGSCNLLFSHGMSVMGTSLNNEATIPLEILTNDTLDYYYYYYLYT